MNSPSDKEIAAGKRAADHLKRTGHSPLEKPLIPDFWGACQESGMLCEGHRRG